MKENNNFTNDVIRNVEDEASKVIDEIVEEIENEEFQIVEDTIEDPEKVSFEERGEWQLVIGGINKENKD